MNDTMKRTKRTRWNTETFKRKVFELVGNEYTFFGEYVNNRTKMPVIHNKCGNEYEVRPGGFLQGSRCERCRFKERSKQYTKTHEQFLKELYEVHGNEYEPLQKYTGVFNKIEFKHKECGNVWVTSPSVILGGSTCKHCYKKVYDDATFKKKMFDIVGSDFTADEEYVDSRTKIKIKHNKCGKKFEAAPHNFLRFHSCPYCDQKSPRYSERRFMDELKQTLGNDYGMVSKVYRIKTDIYEFIHNRCGRTFEMTGSDILRGRKCPHCKMSNGEEKIARYLEKNRISYENEYRFDDCRYKIPLPFDFAIFSDEKILCLIEFQGEQHYRSIKTWGGDEGLKARKRNDKIKRDYCQDNGIKLIEIPYWEEEKIPKLLQKTLL